MAQAGGRFWGGSDSESDVSSSSASSESSAVPAAAARTTRPVYESDSDWSDEERVVRTSKQKREMALRAVVRRLRRAMATHEWTSVLSNFEQLKKEFNKAASVVRKEVCCQHTWLGWLAARQAGAL